MSSKAGGTGRTNCIPPAASANVKGLVKHLDSFPALRRVIRSLAVVRLLAGALLMSLAAYVTTAADWPALPAKDSVAMLPAQEWPQRPGARQFRVLVHYPGGSLDGVNAQTGLMLTLHNWGGSDCVGTADPRVLAQRLNVVAIGVNYLQSGKADSVDAPEPYDFGYLQALDALRALWWVRDRLTAAGKAFADDRTFCTGGSGGGNVTLMANKLAPRTFACIVDMCGMKKLSDDIAFNLPGGSRLDARWSRDPRSRNYLTADEQALRFVGHPAHLAAMKQLGTTSKIVVIHGTEDNVCPYADAVEMVDGMKRAGLDVEAKFISKADLDGKVHTTAGHFFGTTEIVMAAAEKYLRPDGAEARRRVGPSDFARREAVRYRTPNGEFVIAYAEGFPVGRFEPGPPAAYRDHAQLLVVKDADGKERPVKTKTDWAERVAHIRAGMQQVMGPLPEAAWRVPLDVEIVSEERTPKYLRRKVRFTPEPGDRVPAWLLIPHDLTGKAPAMLCLHQTTRIGKDEPAGLGGLKPLHYAHELAERGYVCLVPDYPSFGEYPYDFKKQGAHYASGSMKAIWNNLRAVDLLEGLPQVDSRRLGVIGHSLGGHNSLFTAVFDERLKAVVSSCGFTPFHDYYGGKIAGWTSDRYMPRIRDVYENNADKMPFDFYEILGALAPRGFFSNSPLKDSNFDIGGVRKAFAKAGEVYALMDAPDRLKLVTPDAPHDFPEAERKAAYEWLDRVLK